MNWFNKLKSGIQTLVRRRMPDRVWVKCERCEQIIYQKQLEKNTGICPHCKHHVRISSAEYIAAVLDKGSFEEIGREVKSTDPLAFVDLKPYPERLKEYRKRVQMDAAVLAGTGKIDKMRVGIAVHEIGFIGGSLGSAEGERICRVIERCMRDQLPLIIVSRSGGARMQESVLSLMQMAKVNAALSQFSAEGLLFISVLTDPTTAGVAASYASIGDVNIAEPNALIGFTGPRITGSSVSAAEMEALRQAQRAEQVLEHGFVDMIVSRNQMKATLSQLIAMLASPRKESA